MLSPAHPVRGLELVERHVSEVCGEIRAYIVAVCNRLCFCKAMPPHGSNHRVIVKIRGSVRPDEENVHMPCAAALRLYNTDKLRFINIVTDTPAFELLPEFFQSAESRFSSVIFSAYVNVSQRQFCGTVTLQFMRARTVAKVRRTLSALSARVSPWAYSCIQPDRRSL